MNFHSTTVKFFDFASLRLNFISTILLSKNFMDFGIFAMEIGWIGRAERRLCARNHVASLYLSLQPSDALEFSRCLRNFPQMPCCGVGDEGKGVNYCRRRSFQLKFNTSIVKQPFLLQGVLVVHASFVKLLSIKASDSLHIDTQSIIRCARN